MEVRKTFEELEGFVETLNRSEVKEVFVVEQKTKTENGIYIELVVTALDLKLLPKGDSFLKTQLVYNYPIGLDGQMDEKTYNEKKLEFFNKFSSQYDGKVYKGYIV